MSKQSKQIHQQKVDELKKELAAKNRELEIEAALEKVRSQSLAMHKSKDLEIVITVLLKQLEEVGILLDTASIVIPSKDKKTSIDWTASKKYKYSKGFIVPFMENGKPALSGEINRDIVAILKSVKEFTKSYSKKEKDKYYQNLFDKSGFSETPEARKKFLLSLPGISVSTAGSKNSYIQIFSYSGEELSAADLAVLKRFAMVFEQCYIRFQDLEKAEAHAREAQIEAALEKVRSRSLAMHKSDELQDVVNTVFKRLKDLEIDMNVASIFIFKEGSKDWEQWVATSTTNYSKYFHIPYTDNLVFRDLEEAKQKRNKFYSVRYSLKQKNEWFSYAFKNTEYSQIPDDRKKYILESKFFLVSFAMSKHSGIQIAKYEGKDFSQEENEILKRFSHVFEQAYVRFLDLQKAEAQARETEIQLALERIRARSMAMHRSDELSETASVLFQQFNRLGFLQERITIGIIKEEETLMELWSTDQAGHKINRKLNVDLTGPDGTKIIEAWNAKKESLSIELSGQKLVDWINYVRNNLNVSLEGDNLYKKRVHSLAFFSHGMIIMTTQEIISKETLNLMKRFASVFSLTYRRFLDLKKAETQAREAKIEAALEKVRGRSLAMHKSEELQEVIEEVFRQLKYLDLTFDNAIIGLPTKDLSPEPVWMATKNFELTQSFSIPFDKMDNPIINNTRTLLTTGQEFYHSKAYPAEEAHKYYFDMLTKTTLHKIVPEEHKKFLLNLPQLSFSIAGSTTSYLLIHSYSGNVLSSAQAEVLKRFARVFEQTYTRFLDLKKAEKQAREAQIQASLERVRASAMAMHKSDELLDVCEKMFKEFLSLGFDEIRNAFINIHNDADNAFINYDYAEVAGKSVNRFTNDVLPFVSKMMKASHSANDAFSESHLKGKSLTKFRDLRKQSGQKDEPRLNRTKSLYFYSYSIGIGAIGISTYGPIHAEKKALLKRFRDVFNLSYKRYIDISKAEAQAREAEIQLALERVRARTMAMHKSDELAETAAILFQQMTELGVTPERLNICLIKEEDKILEVWATDQQGIKISHHFNASLDEPTTGKRVYDAWKEKKKSIVIDLSGKELNDWIRYVREVMGMTIKAELVREHRIHSVAFFSQGMILTTTPELLPEESIKLLERFADVFNLTYRRFLDLQKAEAQTREAQIEAALERVRARSMAMHKSDELKDVVRALYNEFRILVTDIDSVNIQLNLDSSKDRYFWASVEEDIYPELYHLPYSDLRIFEKFYNAFNSPGDGFFDYLLNKEEKDAFFREVFKIQPVPPKRKKMIQNANGMVMMGWFHKHSGIDILRYNLKRFSEEDKKIVRRFAAAFEQTYIRFLDLQKAEAQAREAVKQASLDRVRGEIASMRTAEDLNRITPIIWHELKALEVPFIRCGVFIIDEDNAVTQVYLTTPEGKSLGVLNLSFDANELTRNTVDHWRKKQVYREHWNKEKFINWTKSMMELGQVQNTETYQGSSQPPESLNLHFVPFAQGMLYAGDVSPLTDDKLDLVKTLAEAFSIAYARYEDFKNLEEAKNKIEITFKDLKSAQAQLIHAEKLASLGELTAGIAHEIKNPLNFVNNFSELSRELLDDMKEELNNNHTEEAMAIIGDLIQNLEKINQHGKRADSIVKGMLLHSRGTSGEKAPTDINDLLEQFVNLAYHGMRAQNKDFNITIERNYHKTLEKINVVPQDISRVFLNIINNACYAAYDRKKNSRNKNFSPTLRVSTKDMNGKIEIRIGDNGNGIPKEIIDKIFQPFFTTKPSGVGTGLGLSLSYDIVTKVHDGELKVETQEGEGSAFTIILPKKLL